MLDKLRNTAKHTIVYSLGNLSLKAIGLVLLPLYTSHLTLESYGALTILEITSMLIVSILSLKLSTAMMRWCSVEKNVARRKELVFTTYFFSLLVVAVINTGFYPFHSQLSDLFFNTPGFKSYFLILIASASFEILNLYPLELVRMKEKSLLYIIIISVRLTIILGFNIFFIVYKGMGIKGVLLAQLIGQAGVFVITIPLLISNIRLRIDFKELGSMVSYGLPLSFSAISMMLLTVGDRYLIKHFLKYSDVGIYSLGYKIASVLNMFVIQSFQMGFLPIAYRMFEQPDAKRFFSKTLTYMVLVMVTFGLIISLFSKEIIEGFSKNTDFFIAYKIVPFIVLAFTLKGIQYVFSLGLHFTKKTKYNAVIVLVVAVINIALNFVFIPKLGIYGAAITTIISWLIMVVVFYKVSGKFYKVPFELKKITTLLVLFVIICLISGLTDNYPLLIRIIIKFVLLLSIPGIVFTGSFLEPVEKERLKGLWRKWKNPKNWKVNSN